MEPTTTAAARDVIEVGVGEGLVTALIGYGLTIVVAFAAAGFIWAIVVLLERMQKRAPAQVAAPSAVSVAVAPDTEQQKEDDMARHAAAIAAAVYATIGAHRLVYVGEAASQPGWRTTGRVLHQSSHLPKRSPNR